MKSAPITRNINYTKIPVNIIPVCDDGMAQFNAEVKAVREKGYKTLTRARGGGISLATRDFKPPMYDIRALGSCIELTVIANECYRVQFRNDFTKTETDSVSGSTAFKIFKNELLKDGVDLEEYAIDNGAEVKAAIPAPKLSQECESDIEYRNAHHIDIHSAYLSGIAEVFDELRPTIERIYAKRKTDPSMKAVLTHTFGYMQSQMVNYRFAHLSKVAVERTIEKIESLAQNLTATGRKILAFNTDGIWYQGGIYHGLNEGRALGEWSNDHTNCIIKFKGIGTYGYYENGFFKPVVRALRGLDKIKPRSEWTMEDLDRLGETIGYQLCVDGLIRRCDE